MYRSLGILLVMVGIQGEVDLPEGLSQCQFLLHFRAPLYAVPQTSVLPTAPPGILIVYSYLIVVTLVVGVMGTFFDVLLKPQS